MASCILAKDGEFQVLETLGSGGFGCAYLIQHKKYGKIVLKKLRTEEFGEEHLEKLRKEAKIQRELRHPNIVALYDEQFDANNCGLFLEYMEHGPVNEFLDKSNVTCGLKIQILHDVGLAMLFLHSQQPAIIHGDLKCQNILIGKEYNAKITDFGHAQTIQSISEPDNGNSKGGTIEYMAPECLKNPPEMKTEHFDVYSFGISMWEVFSQERAYGNCARGTVCVHVLEGHRPAIGNITANVPECVLKLLESCWDQKPEKRPTFKEITEIIAGCMLPNQLYANKAQLMADPQSIQTENYISKRFDSVRVFDNEAAPKKEIPNANQSTENQPHQELKDEERRRANATLAVANLDQSQLLFEHSSTEALERYNNGFRKVRRQLAQYMDPENLLLLCLLDRGVLTEEEYNILHNMRKPYKQLNEEIMKCISPKLETCCGKFLDALVLNEQQHIVKFIISSGTNDGEDRVLTSDEIYVINNNLFGLVNLLNPYRMNFLYRLVETGCITDTHLEKVESVEETPKMVHELLMILKRRSYKDFCNFKKCLHDTMQNKIVEILEQGGLVGICVTLKERKDKDVIESKIIDLVTGYVDESIEIDKKLSEEQIRIIKDILQELKKKSISLLGNSAWRSIAIYFRCEDIDSHGYFIAMVQSGQIMEIIERLFCCLVDLHEKDVQLIENVSIIEQSNYPLWLRDDTICQPPAIPDEQYQGINPSSLAIHIDQLPFAFLDFILRRTSIYMWMDRYKKHSTEVDKSVAGVLDCVNNVLAEVCSYWRQLVQRKSFKQWSLNRIYFRMFRISAPILIDRLDIRHGFIDRLRTSGAFAVGGKEYELVEQLEFKIKHRHRIYDDKQFIAWNSSLVNCLLSKKENSLFVMFLGLLRDTSQHHILNYIHSFGERSIVFGDEWPLENTTRRLVIANRDKLMKIHPMIGGRKEEYKGKPVKTIEVNLIEMLYTENCISVVHRDFILNQPTLKFKNFELLHLLQNGSIKLFNLTSDFLKNSRQTEMYQVMKPNSAKKCAAKLRISPMLRSKKTNLHRYPSLLPSATGAHLGRNRCGYCKRGGHSLYEDCDDGTVNIACPKSDHCDRNFDSVEHFQEFLDRRSRVESVCEELWELDDRLQPNEDYMITPNARKLFKFVRQAAINDGGILETYCYLLKFYHEREGVYEHYNPRKVNELYDFIDLVMETPVMQRVYDELVEFGFVQNKKTFRKQLWDLWFKFYGEQYRCAFKHIFCGEIEYKHNHGYTDGLHNWIRYYEQQREGHIEYLGWVGDEAPDKSANMVKIEFKWKGILKKKSSMFVGTRPEFEMALYTLLYFIGDEGAPNNAMFGDHEVDIHIVRGVKGQQPGLLTAYPEEVEEDYYI